MLPPSEASHRNHPLAGFRVASPKVVPAQLKKRAKCALDLDIEKEMEQEHLQKHL